MRPRDMMMRVEQGSKRLEYGIAAGIFLAFFVIFASLQFMSPSLTSQDDGYYHIRHSLEYCTGVSPLSMPIYSTMSARPSDLYFGYHALMCPFTAFWGDGYAGQIAGFKIYNSLLAAGFVALFYLIAFKLFKGRLRPAFAAGLAIAAVLFLFTSNTVFFGRIYFARPHMVGIAAVFLSYYFIERKMWKSLFAAAFLLPLFYSVSFVALYPAIMFLVASALYEPRSIASRDAWKPLAISLAGFGLGLALHPDSFDYAYNAFYVHLRAIANRFAEPGIGEGSELYRPGVHLRNDFLWILPWVPIAAVYLKSLAERRSLRRSIAFPDFYLLLQTAVLLPGFLLVERLAEYFIPYMALLSATMLYNAARRLPRLNDEYDRSARSAESPREAAVLIPLAVASGLFRKRRWLAAFSALWFLLALGVNYNKFAGKAAEEKPLAEYLGAAEFMERNSNDGDIVFIIGFDQYPRLVIFNNKNRYIMGMGSTFTYMFDPSLYWKYYHIVHNEPICGDEFCSDGEDEDLYQVLKNDFKAKYFFADAKRYFLENSGKKSGIYDRVEGDFRFKKAYTDPDRPHISVYEL